jgi:two-component system NarL family sensor kinase
VTDPRPLRAGPRTGVNRHDEASLPTADGGPVSQHARVLRIGTRGELGLLIGVGFLMMLVIGVGAVFATRSVAQRQALEDSERISQRLADIVVKPLWTGYPARDPSKDAELKRALRIRVTEGNVTEVTIWSADGTVLFSDKEEDIGKKLPPPEQLPAALAGETTSDFQDGQPEADANTSANPTETSDDRFVEVYTPFQVAGEPPMVFEAYYDYDQVSRLANQLLRQALPLVLIPLLILQLVEVPIAISLARRIKRHENDRSRLLEHALNVSDRQRVGFAADLHDGPIQDLVGINFALGGVAPTVAGPLAPVMRRVQVALQRAIQDLRGLMTDLYPPDLRGGHLNLAIATLADRLRDEGIDVQLNLAEVPALNDEVALSLYRVARESLANVQEHARASTVRISVTLLRGLHGTEQPWVRLVVADDGLGFDPATIDRRAEGHLGLLIDRAESLHGELSVTSTVGHGTTVQADLPIGPAIHD